MICVRVSVVPRGVVVSFMCGVCCASSPTVLAEDHDQARAKAETEATNLGWWISGWDHFCPKHLPGKRRGLLEALLAVGALVVVPLSLGIFVAGDAMAMAGRRSS